MRTKRTLCSLAILIGIIPWIFAVEAEAAKRSRQKVYGEESPEQALVYVIRRPFPGDSLQKIFIYSDGLDSKERLFGVLENSSYTFGYLEPGLRTLFFTVHGVVSAGRLTPKRVEHLKSRGTTIELGAGETYYVDLYEGQIRDPVEARKAIENTGFYVEMGPKEMRRATQALAELEALGGSAPSREALILSTGDKKDEPWDIGYTAEDRLVHITEFVRPGESVETWTELLTLQVFNKVIDLGSLDEYLANYGQELVARCPGSTVDELSRGPEDLLFVAHIRNCEQGADEEVLARVIDGHASRVLVHYSVREPVFMTAERYAEWLERLEAAKLLVLP